MIGYRSRVQGYLPTRLPQKLIQTMRDEVNTCFSEILHEIKQLQMKVLNFMEKEEADALGKLGNSIQQSHNRLLKLEGDSVWLHSLLDNRNDEQFLQARPPGDQALFLYRERKREMYQAPDKEIRAGITLARSLTESPRSAS